MRCVKLAGMGAVVGTCAMSAVHTGPYALTLGAYLPGIATPLHRLLPGLYGIGRQGRVAVTFDDGPDARGTPRILESLRDLKWQATFFMVGEMVRRNPTVVREVIAAGHEVALHSDKHESFLRKTLPVAIEDLRRSRDAVESAAGTEVRYFRPPFGKLSASALVAARMLGLHTVLWTSWGKDWRAGATSYDIAAEVRKGLLDGGTILLHDSDCVSSPNSWVATLGAIPLIAGELQARAISPGTLTSHFSASTA